MRKHKHLFLGSRTISLIILICLAFLGVSAWTSGTWSHKRPGGSNIQSNRGVTETETMAEKLKVDNVPVRNMTRSFRLIALEKLDNKDIRLTLQNDYDKNINGFWVYVGGVGTEVGPIYEEERMILPGGTYVIDLPIQEQTDTRGIGIIAVTFEDGTGDGETDSLFVMRETRKGEKEQVKRILKLIKQHLVSEDADSLENLTTLEAKIKALSTEGKNGQRDPFSSGLISAKQRAIAIIQRISSKKRHAIQALNSDLQKRDDFSIQSELTKTIKYFEKILSIQ
jgi:hypothetical protein